MSARTPDIGRTKYSIMPLVCGMVDVEAVQLAVAHQVDAGLLLRVEHDAHGVDERLLGRRGGEPVGHRVGADHRGLDARGAHGARL